MRSVPTTPLDGKRRTTPPPVVLARGYGIHYLKNTVAFWGIAALAGAGLIASALLTGFWPEVAPAGFVIAGGGAVIAVALFRGGRALWDLLDKPIFFQGRVAGKSASVFLNRLAFLEEKYHLRIVRGKDHRPLAYGTGRELAEGWFLTGLGYYEIAAEGASVRGYVYRRTRVVASLVKL